MWIVKPTIALFGVVLCLQAPSHAQQNENRQFNADKAKRTSSPIYKVSNAYPEELLLLDEKLKKPNLTKLEKSDLLTIKAGLHYELDQTPQTIQAFEDAIAAGGLSNENSHKFRLNIAILWITQGKYERGAEMLEQWGKDGNLLKPQHTEILMQAWVQSDNYERALPWAEKWYNEARPKERKHYDLMNFLYNNLERSEKQIEMVKAMMTRWPDDKTLWDALASVHARNGHEREAFEIKRVYYLTGNFHSENDILLLVQYHSDYEMPHDAAQILEKEIKEGSVSKTLKNMVWLSMLYQDARNDEKAVSSFQQAINMSDAMMAETMRAELQQAPKVHIYYSYLLREKIREFKAPKIDRGKFKIQAADRDAQPLVRIKPIMPKHAKKSGYCKVRFNVDKYGQPENIVAPYCTQKLFEMPSIKSVEQWKYKPKIVDGRQVARFGTESYVDFRVKDNNGNTIPE